MNNENYLLKIHVVRMVKRPLMLVMLEKKMLLWSLWKTPKSHQHLHHRRNLGQRKKMRLNILVRKISNQPSRRRNTILSCFMHHGKTSQNAYQPMYVVKYKPMLTLSQVWSLQICKTWNFWSCRGIEKQCQSKVWSSRLHTRAEPLLHLWCPWIPNLQILQLLQQGAERLWWWSS